MSKRTCSATAARWLVTTWCGPSTCLKRFPKRKPTSSGTNPHRPSHSPHRPTLELQVNRYLFAQVFQTCAFIFSLSQYRLSGNCMVNNDRLPAAPIAVLVHLLFLSSFFSSLFYFLRCKCGCRSNNHGGPGFGEDVQDGQWGWHVRSLLLQGASNHFQKCRRYTLRHTHHKYYKHDTCQSWDWGILMIDFKFWMCDLMQFFF